VSAELKVNVPEGKSGAWSVRRFTVDEESSRLDAVLSLGKGGRFVPPGEYTGLFCGHEIIMSDTPDEIRDHRHFIGRARGRVLIAGLGLGLVLQAVARKPDVTAVLVVEISPDVLALVRPHYAAMPWAHKVEIEQGDILERKPAKGEVWDAAWFDIWDALCTDNLAEMATLHRRYARRADYYGSWGHGLLKARREQERKQERYWR
jgi:SAM-dependent methyltransferase